VLRFGVSPCYPTWNWFLKSESTLRRKTPPNHEDLRRVSLLRPATTSAAARRDASLQPQSGGLLRRSVRPAQASQRGFGPWPTQATVDLPLRTVSSSAFAERRTEPRVQHFQSCARMTQSKNCSRQKSAPRSNADLQHPGRSNSNCKPIIFIAHGSKQSADRLTA